MSISGFTFVHNAYTGGYPIVEAIAAVRPFVDEVVAVDMDSTDGTRDLLERHADLVLDSCWDCGVKPMNVAFSLHVACKGDHVLLFEADEIWEPKLAQHVCALARTGAENLQVWRVQVSQNGQRMGWGPHPVHRLFPRGEGTYLDNPVIAPDDIPTVGPEWGYLWDLTGWFRDCYRERRKAHGECFGPQRNVMIREHFLQNPNLSDEELENLLTEPHWEAKESPFALPEIVRPLLGKTRYEP